MPEYRCYFFGPDDQPSGGDRVYAAVESFVVRTDDEAKLKAHALYRRRNQPHGFEIWQADMLVCRHPGIVLDITLHTRREKQETKRLEGQSHG